MLLCSKIIAPIASNQFISISYNNIYQYCTDNTNALRTDPLSTMVSFFLMNRHIRVINSYGFIYCEVIDFIY